MTVAEIYQLQDLKVVRLLVPTLIPKELIELVKGRTFTPEQFYRFQEDRASLDNDMNHLFAYWDPDRNIVGFLWAEINQLDRTLFVNTFSIDKKYWKNGEAMNLAIDVVERLVDKYKCPRTFWMTQNPKYYQKHGFKVSKNVAMEYVGLGLSEEIEGKFKRG